MKGLANYFLAGVQEVKEVLNRWESLKSLCYVSVMRN